MTPRSTLLLAVLALAPLGCGGGGSNPIVIQQNPNTGGNYPNYQLANTITWDTNASAHRDQVGQRFTFRCPPGGTAGYVWGSNPYTDDSSICTAAVHRGVFSLASGGDVTIEMRPGQASYTGVTNNGIASQNYGAWGGSFLLVL